MSLNQWRNWPTYFGEGRVSASTIVNGHTYTLHIKHEELRYRVRQVGRVKEDGGTEFSWEPDVWMISNADFALMCAPRRK